MKRNSQLPACPLYESHGWKFFCKSASSGRGCGGASHWLLRYVLIKEHEIPSLSVTEWKCPCVLKCGSREALWGFIFSLHNFHFKHSYFVSQRAFFFSSFLFFSFCLSLKWTQPGIQESSCALSASDIVRKPEGGSWSSNSCPQNENLAPLRDSESWGHGLPSPAVSRVRPTDRTLPGAVSCLKSWAVQLLTQLRLDVRCLSLSFPEPTSWSKRGFHRLFLNEVATQDAFILIHMCKNC